MDQGLEHFEMDSCLGRTVKGSIKGHSRASVPQSKKLQVLTEK